MTSAKGIEVLGFAKGKGQLVHAIRPNKKTFCDAKREMEPEVDQYIINLNCGKCLRYRALRKMKEASISNQIEEKIKRLKNDEAEPAVDPEKVIDETKATITEDEPEPIKIEPEPIKIEPAEIIWEPGDYCSALISVGRVEGFITSVGESTTFVRDEKNQIWECDHEAIVVMVSPQWYREIREEGKTFEQLLLEEYEEAELGWAKKDDGHFIVVSDDEDIDVEESKELIIKLEENGEVTVRENSSTIKIEDPKAEKTIRITDGGTKAIKKMDSMGTLINWAVGDIVTVNCNEGDYFAKVVEIYSNVTVVMDINGKEKMIDNGLVEYIDPDTGKEEIYSNDWGTRIWNSKIQIIHKPSNKTFFDNEPVEIVNTLILELNSMKLRWKSNFDPIPPGFISQCRAIRIECYRLAGLIPSEVKMTTKEKKKKANKTRKLLRRMKIRDVEPTPKRRLKRRKRKDPVITTRKLKRRNARNPEPQRKLRRRLRRG